MPATAKVTILLADEDALRRDGLSAVLSGNENFEVVSRVPDGEAALDQIRETQPDIAIVDLNLPRVHGIELIRRVRAEALRTKIVILAGTTDDEIIREVIRAGGDGYLLKNGPARHLIDAIGYVRDGGQYFSPQLRRDGRDRHLFEEPPRQYGALEAPRQYGALERAGNDGPEQDRPRERESSSERDNFRERDSARERDRKPRPSRSRRNERRPGDPQQFRERIREEAGGSGLGDRDYEIMTMMAEGIRPILDRLDEIDNRVAQMEEGDAPVPNNPRGWLTRQLAETLDSRGQGLEPTRTAREMEARLPEMIEEAVSRRFNQMAGKLQEQIEESHVKTLETFVKNIQVKLVQRVSALEQDMGKQADAMQQLREYSMRTEDNLSRLISGVDKLAQELPKRLAMARQEQEEAERAARASRAERDPRNDRQSDPQDSGTAQDGREPSVVNVVRKPLRKPAPKSGRTWKIVAGVLGGILVLALLVWGAMKINARRAAPAADNPPAAAVAAAPATGGLVKPPANADTKTKLAAAQQFADSKDYATAEDLYKQVINVEPQNVEALKGLASVLYREDKIDESAAVLDRIPK